MNSVAACTSRLVGRQMHALRAWRWTDPVQFTSAAGHSLTRSHHGNYM